VIAIGPAPKGKTVASMKEEALKRIGSSLVGGGDLPNGHWTDLVGKEGGHIIGGVVVSKYAIACTSWVSDEEKLQAARAVCTSLETF